MERLEAVLLAGAAGDGFGGPFEGKPADRARELPAPTAALRLSDDTQPCVLAVSSPPTAVPGGRAADVCHVPGARAGRRRPRSGGGRLRRRLSRRFGGGGSSTLKALRDLADGQHWALAGATGEFAAGNGAAMRIAPLAFFGDVGDATFVRTIADIARITHRNDEAISAAIAVVCALQLAGGRRQTRPSAKRETARNSPQTRREVLASLVATLPDTALSDALVALAALPELATASDAAKVVGTSGRAAQSVALALFLGAGTASIAGVIREALQCGGDTDTVAALAAQIRAAAGQEVPEAWIHALPTDEVTRLATALRARQARRRWLPW
jgi:ADP-ribosylglycohydrolase